VVSDGGSLYTAYFWGEDRDENSFEESNYILAFFLTK